MESPISARHGPFSTWTLQPDSWDSKFMGSSRFSSYATKIPAYRYNEADAFRLADSSYLNWPRESISSPTELPWQQGTISGFPFSTQRKDFAESPHHHVQGHDHSKALIDHGMTVKQPVNHESSPSSTLPSSNGTGAQATRAPKRHVKSACINCKRAHLSCDVLRPCTRCIQTGKTPSCVDVPQRRKGRPRLRQDSVRKSGRAGTTKPLSAKPLAAAQEHSQLNPLPNYAYSGFSMPAELYNVCSYIPMVFLSVDLRIVQTNQHFRRLFDFHGDLHGRRLEHLIETSDFGRLESVQWALRQEIEKEMSIIPAPVQLLEHGDVSKIPNIESHDIFRITKPFVTRRETIQFRFADGNSRPLSVDFSLSRTEVLFVTLALPPIRSDSIMFSSLQRQQRQQHYHHASAASTPSSYTQQAFDPSRNPYGRQFDRMSLLPLPSPDTLANFSTSPTSSYSLSSTASSVPPSSRHASFASHRSYEQSVVPTPIGNPQTVSSGQLESYPKYIVQGYSIPQPQTTTGQALSSSSSTHLAPLKDRNPSLINSSRKLPPIPGLGSPDSQASDNAGSQASRSQQICWQNQSQEQSTKLDNKTVGSGQGQSWQNESPSRRSRLDVKELAT